MGISYVFDSDLQHFPGLPMTPSRPDLAAVHYRIDPSARHQHLYQVELTIQAPSAGQELSLPVWIPGSYLVREFSKNLQALSASQAGAPVTLEQLDKCSWRAACAAGQPLQLRYQVAAYDTSVRSAWLDAGRGFFNGTSLCLRVHGQEDARHELQVLCPQGAQDWRLATGLPALEADAAGFGRYQAGSYDELVDCPVELGPFWSGEFSAAGVPHRLVLAGAAPSVDTDRLLRDSQRICQAAIQFWHPEGAPPPHASYVFLLNVVHEGYGGLEHRNSTALICSRRDLPRQGVAAASEGYATLLGLISHEYFHTWNVKRLRPAAFARYDYACENYTELLWFFEGFTSYYDDLLLLRAGLIDQAAYLRLLAKSINLVQQTPGRQVQTVAQASLDAWIKYYRQDENTPNATVSYYTKGSLVALCLDLALRQQGRATLDDVMRALWQRCQGGPMAEADLLQVLQALTGRPWEQELQAWVHSTRELPLAELLGTQGITLAQEAAPLAQRLGLRVSESGGSIHVKAVLRGGLAEAAGFMAGDEWLGIEADGQAWRLRQLDELLLYAGPSAAGTALVARDQRLLRLPLAASSASSASSASGAQDNIRLELSQPALAAGWLGQPVAPV